jgi:hypothetical protein
MHVWHFRKDYMILLSNRLELDCGPEPFNFFFFFQHFFATVQSREQHPRLLNSRAVYFVYPVAPYRHFNGAIAWECGPVGASITKSAALGSPGIELGQAVAFAVTLPTVPLLHKSMIFKFEFHFKVVNIQVVHNLLGWHHWYRSIIARRQHKMLFKVTGIFIKGQAQ